MFLNGISLIANTWFPDDERAIATALMTLASPLGSMISFIIQGVFIAEVNGKVEPGEDPSAAVRHGTYNLLILESSMITVTSLFLIFAIREKPLKPPSRVALIEINWEGSGQCNDLYKIFGQVNFMLLCFVFSIIFAIYVGMASVINPLLSPFGYSPGMIAIIGILFILMGVVSCLLVGFILDRTKKYLLTLRIICVSATLCGVLALWWLPLENNMLCYIVVALIGFTMVPIIPVGFAFATELTHPIQPSLSNGIMMSFASLSAFSLSFGMIGLCNMNHDIDPQ